MGIFGWDYPPGCSSVPGDDCNDGDCWFCGKELPEDDGEIELTDEQDQGFCNAVCMEAAYKYRRKNEKRQ